LKDRTWNYYLFTSNSKAYFWSEGYCYVNRWHSDVEINVGFK